VPLIESPSLPATSTGSATSSAHMRWSVRRWVWMSGLASIAAFALGGVYGVPAATSSPDYTAQVSANVRVAVHESTTTTTASTTTTTVPPATTTTTTAPTPAPAPAPTPAPAPAPTPAPAVLAATPPPAPVAPALPSYGHATVWGCTAALAYLQAYAAPGFALDCPGYAEGHEAMTCLHGTPQYPDACLNGPEIAISDPCPQAYMNESANSWLLTGQTATEQAKFGLSYASIDPFGACP
jgi:hypothetical protein